tara:strand:- start:1232 stop:1687 length:456 start_codon:yes stop_codon:yes gene_type:complete
MTTIKELKYNLKDMGYFDKDLKNKNKIDLCKIYNYYIFTFPDEICVKTIIELELLDELPFKNVKNLLEDSETCSFYLTIKYNKISKYLNDDAMYYDIEFTINDFYDNSHLIVTKILNDKKIKSALQTQYDITDKFMREDEKYEKYQKIHEV